MTLLGATTNTAIGFVFPIIFYLKMEERMDSWEPRKIFAYGTLAFMVFSSITTLIVFVAEKIN